MIKSGKRRWMLLSAASLILWLGRADSQQESQTTAPQNPYLMGSEGYDKGPRGLTSYHADRHRPAVRGQDGRRTWRQSQASNANTRRCSRSATT